MLLFWDGKLPESVYSHILEDTDILKINNSIACILHMRWSILTYKWPLAIGH